MKPKKKILLHGAPGCGKTLSAERIAWNLGLPLLKVRFDSLISSYFGESASNLRLVFDYCKKEPVVLLLDECDFIAKSRIATQDVGEVPRIVNMLLVPNRIFLIHPALRMKYPLVGTEQEWQALCYILLKSLAREIFGYLHGYET